MDIAQEPVAPAILAEDEMALYLQATLTRVWAPLGQPPVVRVDPGRTKRNFYGTLDLQTGKVMATQAPVMNAAATAQHLGILLTAFPDRPILLLWDRAPWHRGAAIRAILQANPRLEILPLPVAAPDLNPQEQVWKATRDAISHHHDHSQLATLADQFDAYLNQQTFTCSLLDRYGFNTIRPMFN